MRGLIALVVIIYLAGVGVVLEQAKWTSVSASDFAVSLGQNLPYALAWPARVYRGMIDQG